MELLSGDAILAADDLRSERVEVEEWGGVVIVGELTARERDAFESQCLSKAQDAQTLDEAMENARARLLVLCLKKEDGTHLFEQTEEEVEKLGSKSSRVLTRLAAVAQRVNALSPSSFAGIVGK